MCKTEKSIYDKIKKSGKTLYFDKYKIIRKDNKKLFRQLKKNYYHSKLFEPLSEGDSKSFYNHVKELKSTSNDIKSLESGTGSFTEDKQKIVDILNSYIQSVFTTRSNLPDIIEQDTLPITVNKLGVTHLLINLKSGKAPGPDKLTKEILCLDIDICAEILTNFQFLPVDWHSTAKVEMGTHNTNI